MGRVVEAVDRHGLAERTLIVFTSDNGGSTYSRNAPLSKGKGTLWEGRIRVPSIARWAGTLPAGARSSQVACTMDWGATLVALAGDKAPGSRPFDGINLLPILRGEARPVPRTLFWRRSLDPHRRNVEPHRAARQGDWKYIDRPDGTQYLYDLSQDVAEQHNLISGDPDRAWALKASLDRWERDADRSARSNRKQRHAAPDDGP